jgi:hypothetical protein
MMADDTPVLDEGKIKIFAAVTGFFAFAGSSILIITTTIQRNLYFSLDNTFPKTLARISCAGNIAYVSPNLPSIVNLKTEAKVVQLFF